MRRGIAVGVMAFVALALPAGAGASSMTVTLTSDEFGTGSFCSLREAVESANANADFGGCTRTGTGNKDVILLEAGESYVRSRAGIDDTNENGDLDITGNTVFKVVGAGVVTIDANDLDRAIHVLPTGKLKSARLVVQDGLIDSGQPQTIGAGILNRGRMNLARSTITLNDITTNIGCPCGAGVGAYGVNTTLRRVTVDNNTMDVNTGGGLAYLDGNLKVVKSTITGNYAPRGGGMYLGNSDPADRARIIDSTIDGNRAVGEPNSTGGGVWIGSATRPRFTNVTISGNGANGDGGGVYGYSGIAKLNAVTITDNVADYDSNDTGSGGGVYGESVKLRNSIIARNTAETMAVEDCSTTESPDSVGHNLIGEGGGCFDEGSNVATATPRLGPLAANGGATLTHKLKAASPAIGIAANSAPPRDQRGHRRDSAPDAGAYER